MFLMFARICSLVLLSGVSRNFPADVSNAGGHSGSNFRISGDAPDRAVASKIVGSRIFRWAIPWAGVSTLTPFFENSNNSISGTSNKRNNNAGSLQYYEGGAVVRCYLVIVTCWRDLVLGFVLCQQLVNPIVLGIGVGASVGLRRRAGASAACSGRVLTAISSAGVLALIFRAVEHIVWAVGCRIIAQIHLMT